MRVEVQGHADAAEATAGKAASVSKARAGAVAALAGAARRYAPSMGLRIDVGELWTVAVAGAGRKLAADGGPARPMPADCPFAIQDLVRRLPDLDALLARLAQAAATPAGG